MQTRKKAAQFAALENIDKGTFKNALEICKEDDESMLFGGVKNEAKDPQAANNIKDEKRQSKESNEKDHNQKKLLGDKRTRKVNQEFENEFRKLSIKEGEENDVSAEDEVQMETDKDYKCSQPDEQTVLSFKAKDSDQKPNNVV